MILLYGTIFTMGWIVAAIMFGLWWGERGRRMDVQWATGLLRDRQEAKVVNPTPDPEQLTHRLVNEQVRERMVADLMDQGGLSMKTAEEEADRLIAEMFRLGTTDIP